MHKFNGKCLFSKTWLLSFPVDWNAFFIIEPYIFESSSNQCVFFLACLDVDVENRAIFKALINMKCKGMTLSLSHIYNTNPELFSQESLLKHLYD